MSFFKKIGKVLGKVAKAGAQSVLKATPLGQAALKTLEVAAKMRNKGVSHAKMRAMATVPEIAPVKVKAMSDVYGPIDGIASATGAAPRRARKPKAAPKPKSTTKRAPPKGGKDLKALSRSWRAAGKPGRWIDWVKTH
jgi:hypothetical protein